MIISTISVMAISVSLLVSTVTVANSMLLEQYVYAIDNCDPTSTCTNTQLEPVIVRKIIALNRLPVAMPQLAMKINRTTVASQFVLEARLDASILEKVMEIFKKTIVIRLENSVGTLPLLMTIRRQPGVNQLVLPASIFQMAMTILKTTIVTQ